jgi:hypothetical protein
MKNTLALKSKEYEEVKVDCSSVDDVEESLILENAGKSFKKHKEYELIKNLMSGLNIEKREGEKVQDFESRLKQEIDEIIDL